MVKIMENPIKIDDLGKKTYFWVDTHMQQFGIFGVAIHPLQGKSEWLWGERWKVPTRI